MYDAPNDGSGQLYIISFLNKSKFIEGLTSFVSHRVEENNVMIHPWQMAYHGKLRI